MEQAMVKLLVSACWLKKTCTRKEPGVSFTPFNMNIIISTLNAKYIHTSLSIRYLKAYAQPDYDVKLAEYTIKDPIMNIVGDLYSKKPDVIGFSCYIWNIEETMKVVAMLKKSILNWLSFSADLKSHMMLVNGLTRFPELILS